METSEVWTVFQYVHGIFSVVQFQFALIEEMIGGERGEQQNRDKVGHSSNFLYQGFANKYFLGIYLHSKA